MEALKLVYSFRATLYEWVSLFGTVDHNDSNFISFLKETMVCANEVRSAKSNFGPMETKHSDLIDIIIRKLVKRGKENVLNKGFQLSRNGGNGILGHMSEIEMWFPNTIVNDLKRGFWPELTKLIGDQLMVHLFCDYSIFIKYEQGNFLQVTGFPITGLPSSTKRKQSDEICNPNSVKRSRKEDQSISKTIHISFPFHRTDFLIPWSWALYGRPVYDCNKGNIVASLPLNHPIILADLDILLKEIFPFEHNMNHPFLETQILTANSKTRFKRLSRLKKVKELLSNMIRNYKKCNLQALLDHYSPIEKGTSFTFDRPSLFGLHTPTGRIIGFFQSVLKRVIPRDLFGSNNNFRIFLNNLQSLFRVRRYDRLSLQKFVYGIKLSEVKWLYSSESEKYHRVPLDHYKAKHLFHEFIIWLMNGLIIPLVKSNFYVTETGSHKNLIIYFRHKIWTRLSAPLYQTLTNSIYEEIDPKAANISSFGISNLRLLPKSRGLRPIVNLSKKIFGISGKKSSINQLLKPVFEALNCEVDKDGALLGHSVSSKKEIYLELKKFKLNLIESYNHPKEYFRVVLRNIRFPPLFFCKVDIKSCFDSINQSFLKKIINEVLKEMEYTISSFSSVQVDFGKIRKRFLKTAKKDERYLLFSEFVVSVLSKELYDSILVDGVIQQFEDKENLLILIENHIFNHVIKAGKRYFKQVTGIPQGSIVSSLLCSIYYSHFEKSILSSVISGKESLLMRLVDDFLFITSDLKQAQKFALTIHKDYPTIGFQVNPSKSLVNFHVQVNSASLQMVPETCKEFREMGMKFFPWCGLLIEMNNLDILIDYGKIQNTEYRNSLTIDTAKIPGRNFLTKVMICLKNRMHAIHIDPFLNRPQAILINIYQSFLICAYRFVAYVKEAFVTSSINHQYLLFIIEEAINYQVSLLKSRLASLKVPFSTLFRKVDILWLGISAFLYVLKSKQPKFNDIVQKLLVLKAELRLKFIEKLNGNKFIEKLNGNILTVLASNPIHD